MSLGILGNDKKMEERILVYGTRDGVIGLGNGLGKRTRTVERRIINDNETEDDYRIGE